AEWNSGDSSRWRATFTEDAVLKVRGSVYPIEIRRDGYEFFAVLGHEMVVKGCVSGSDGEVVCVAESTQRFTDGLGLPPTEVELRLLFVDGLISEYREHFVGAGGVRAAWRDFVDWIAERNPADARAVQPHPGDALGAEIALSYMDEYFEGEEPQ
ncbi:MAG: hypothetical protein ACR2PK_10770, partial [Acidimicrobiales bacterium]